MKILPLPNGKFRVDVIIHGKRERKNFLSKAMAESFLKQAQTQAYEMKLGLDKLTPKQRIVALEVFRVLPENVNILDLVLNHLKKVDLKLESVQLQDALESFLESLRTGNRRESYIQSIGKTIRRFCRNSDCYVSEVDSKDIEEFLKVCPSPVSRFNYIRDLHIFFEWARIEKYIKENPVTDIRRPLVHRKEPRILTVDQCQALLENTRKADRAFAAIGLFTGIRPSEIRQMTWDMVGDESIRLPAAITKTHTSRTIQLEPNAVAWLAPLKKEAPRMAQDAFTQSKRLRIAAGLQTWPQGALRHTFASYHVTAFENPSRTAFFMHSRQSPDILFRHYFRDTLKSDALKFWQLYPKD